MLQIKLKRKTLIFQSTVAHLIQFVEEKKKTQTNSIHMHY